MARPLRLEFAGALYHVTARGNERRAIFLDDLDTDCAMFLDTLAQGNVGSPFVAAWQGRVVLQVQSLPR